MPVDTLTIAVAEMRGEMRSVREIFNAHTQQDMEQFSELKATMHDLDTKMDQLLIEGARRGGEMEGMRRSAVMLATSISLFVSMAGVAVVFIVG
jgi:hypothetical protein